MTWSPSAAESSRSRPSVRRCSLFCALLHTYTHHNVTPLLPRSSHICRLSSLCNLLCQATVTLLSLDCPSLDSTTRNAWPSLHTSAAASYETSSGTWKSSLALTRQIWRCASAYIRVRWRLGCCVERSLAFSCSETRSTPHRGSKLLLHDTKIGTGQSGIQVQFSKPAI